MKAWLWPIMALVAGHAFAEEAQVTASGAGSFAGAAGLTETAKADEIAALEQQAFREARWEVVVDTAIALAFQVSPPEAATAQLLASKDGELFEQVGFGDTVASGQVLSLIITQARSTTSGTAAFPAADWSYELIAQPVEPREGSTFGPILLPITWGESLGCEAPGCGEGAEGQEVPSVAGDADASAGTAEATSGGGAAQTADRDLARELQTQLARVGCYTIAVDGLWGPGSRRAVSAFNEATGLSLTVNTPSPRALVEVSQRQDRVCTQ